MSSRIVVGVMGPGESASEEDIRMSFELGGLIAQQGWILLTGGRNVGVMDAAARGAKAGGGTVVGVLPDPDTASMSESVDIPIVTGMYSARNSINVLSSRILFFIGMSPGTASELALALKYLKPSILVAQKEETVRVFQSMSRHKLETADSAVSAVEAARKHLAANQPL
jgi:uncharacterized protein (TIGR00725 family)